ncbi:MAG: hypothetical protein RMI85_05960 [Candidatus Korarchaeum sp.]|nr:hypothetical protein [Candidatus Korarchaeum sp.]
MRDRSELRNIEELLKRAKELKAEGDFKGALVIIKRVIQLSLNLVLSRLGIDTPHDSLLSFYYLIPIEMRPFIGERELEYFEQEYGLTLSTEYSLDPRFLEASLDIAERVVSWAESLLKNKI